jgi:hypothetical protein
VATNKTINPAGMPIIKPAGVPKPYTREDFVRDLKKVSSKTPSKPDEAES